MRYNLRHSAWFRGDAAQLYSKEFFEDVYAGSAKSAAIVVPLALSLFPSHSVLDVGCGTGAWLKEFERCGIADYLGVDGDHVPRDLLKIPLDKFMPRDLTTLTQLGRRFDMACSLEVAEHLPEKFSEQFVFLLVKAAPVVLFSAAIPGQGGTDHLNEQWPSYWASLFAHHGYVSVDCIRPNIFYDDRVDWWYRQNVLVFCEPQRCPAPYVPVTTKYDLDRIHPRMPPWPKSGRAATKAAIGNFKEIGKAIIRTVVRGLQK